jgi:ribosome-associated toxin RatA of RatAB toxin-antitoxin module
MADHTRSKITINARPSAVMAVIADIPAYPTWAGPVETAEVLEAGPDGRPLRARFVVNAVLTKDEFVNTYTWNGDESVSWTLVEGKAMSSQEGTYALADLGDGRTEVTYDLTVELNIKIPGLLRKKVQSGVVETAMKDLKKHVEKSLEAPSER